MPTGTPALPVADDLTAQMVAGAVQLSAVKMSASGLPELLLQPGLKKMIEVPMPSTTRDVQQAAAVKVEELTAEQRAQAAKQLDLFLERGVALAELSPGWS